MISINLSRGVHLSLHPWTPALCLPIVACLWYCSRDVEPRSPLGSTQSTQGVLSQVNDLTEVDTDVDIIAIHGLDTKSPDTWIWKDPRDSKNKDKWVNWLEDPRLLPATVGRARIFTCDWPNKLFDPRNLQGKTIEEFARRLLQSIRGQRPEHRPTLFIASCLGGIILMKALVTADEEDHPIKETTRGIIFLATPFRGTSFQDVSKWAEPGLRAWALFRCQKLTKLLSHAKEPTLNLQDLVCSFTRLCQRPDHPYDVFTFYEKGKTNLLRRVFPWLPDWFGKPLVDGTSGTLDIVSNPLALDRKHILMNKFCGGDNDDDYKLVAGKIGEFVQRIRHGDAYAYIQRKHYTKERLGIERLSGDLLSMEQCYINLAVVKQSHKIAQGSLSGGDTAPRSSPFSLEARLMVETPDEKLLVELPTLFGSRQGPDGHANPPRRILIRGRAGVGKTTLCKKIVHDFPGNDRWKALFKRVLWIPLRRLKVRTYSEYNLQSLFFHIYFEGHENGRRLAKEVRRAVDATDGRGTMFILDGLDEVSELLDPSHAASSLLTELLNKPNVIITTRPHAIALPGLTKPDLELETIGFFPDQVDEYLKMTFRDHPQKTSQIQFFLEQRQLIQSLVRIPIQLDALCFTWDKDSDAGIKLDTMTALYQSIELQLWKKDILRLQKKHEGEPVTESAIKPANQSTMEGFVPGEVSFLESLAFTGLCDDMIQFDLAHLGTIISKFAPSLLVAKTVPFLSFLRTSDPSLEFSKQSFHFLHLTYQEYFAARYFVRQWKSGEPLRPSSGKILTAVEFLHEHKYTARYDILWRFVAGLLDAEGHADEFFQEINREPRDLVGPMHQRLVMRCLSEVSAEMSLRNAVEEKLAEWLLFGCKFRMPWESAHLAEEVEFPEKVLCNVLRGGPDHAKASVLWSLEYRPAVPSSIMELMVALLADEDREVRLAAARALGGHLNSQSNPPDAILEALTAALLADEYQTVREAAANALGNHLRLQSNPPEAILEALATALLEDKASGVRRAAERALRQEKLYTGHPPPAHWASNLSPAILRAMTAELNDKDPDIKQAVARILHRQSSLPQDLEDIAAQLRDENLGNEPAAIDPESRKLRRLAATRDLESELHLPKATLEGQSNLPEPTLTALVERLEHKDYDTRWAVIKILEGQSNLPEAILTALVELVEHDDTDTGWHAATILNYQSNLPEAILMEILKISATDDIVRADTSGVIVRSFPPKALSGPLMESLYIALLYESFKEQVSWHIVNGIYYVNMPEGIREAPIVDDEEFRNRLKKARPVGFPLD